ncbi:MAG: hypothetical protein HC788_04890 [Sphingopyxis sp.]|nr:hypothetical protein [Sphingopyxis sp.]
MEIYILPQKLWCNVLRKYPNGKVTFDVINGGWRGSIHGDELIVSETGFKAQGQRIASGR